MSGTKGAPRPAGSWPGWCQRCARPMVKGSGTWCAACGTTDADNGNYGGGFEWLYSQIATLTAQRDAARDIAARLEGECARLEGALREVVTVLGEHGEANHPAQLCALMALGEWDPGAVIAEGES